MTTHPNPVATTSRAERQRLLLREEIIEAALIEFSERGYHQTAISHIAKRLGIGHGTFYRHFKNKRDILEHVIENVTDKVKSAMAEDNAPAAAGTLEQYEQQVRRLGVSLTSIILESPGLFRMLLFEATSVDPDMKRTVTEFLGWCAKQVASYFDNGVRLGFLRKDLDVTATSHVLVGMIMSTVLLSLSTSDGDMYARINDAVLRMLVDGIARH